MAFSQEHAHGGDDGPAELRLLVSNRRRRTGAVTAAPPALRALLPGLRADQDWSAATVTLVGDRVGTGPGNRRTFDVALTRSPGGGVSLAGPGWDALEAALSLSPGDALRLRPAPGRGPWALRFKVARGPDRAEATQQAQPHQCQEASPPPSARVHLVPVRAGNRSWIPLPRALAADLLAGVAPANRTHPDPDHPDAGWGALLVTGRPWRARFVCYQEGRMLRLIGLSGLTSHLSLKDGDSMEFWRRGEGGEGVPLPPGAAWAMHARVVRGRAAAGRGGSPTGTAAASGGKKAEATPAARPPPRPSPRPAAKRTREVEENEAAAVAAVATPPQAAPSSRNPHAATAAGADRGTVRVHFPSQAALREPHLFPRTLAALGGLVEDLRPLEVRSPGRPGRPSPPPRDGCTVWHAPLLLLESARRGDGTGGTGGAAAASTALSSRRSWAISLRVRRDGAGRAVHAQMGRGWSGAVAAMGLRVGDAVLLKRAPGVGGGGGDRRRLVLRVRQVPGGAGGARPPAASPAAAPRPPHPQHSRLPAAPRPPPFVAWSGRRG